LALRLKSGDLRIERERLVRTHAGWLLGDPKHCEDIDVDRSNPRLQRPAGTDVTNRRRSGRAIN
jgi:hypothetical protein